MQVSPRAPRLSPPAAGLAAVVLAALASGQEKSEFMDSFRQAMKLNDKAQMSLLVKTNVDEAILAVSEICEKISVQSSDQLEEEISALGDTWKAAFDSSFVYQQYEYFSLLRGEYMRSRATLVRRYDIEMKKFWNAREEGGTGHFAATGLELEGIGNAFEQLGDFYRAAAAFYFAAQCFDEELAGEDGDLPRACALYGRMIEMRDKLELIQDRFYTYTKERYAALEFDGFGDPSKGPEARAEERAKTDVAYAPIPLNASFELVEELDAFSRPYYMADEAYQMWPWVWLTENGSKGAFPTMEHSPAVLRVGAAKAAIDTDGDGEGEVEFSLGGKLGPVEFTLGSGDEARPWACLVTVGQQEDTYQGFKYNLAPTDTQMMIYVAPAASVVGTFGETEIRIFDDNMDGIYGSPPKTWGYVGMREGDFEPTMDAVLIGDAKVAVPWSRLNQVGEDWYSFEATESGDDVVLQKTEVETGTLVLDLKGLKADWVVMAGESKLEGCFFDLLANGKKGVEVPVGAYKLYCGRVSKGKRNQIMKALIMPPKSGRAWTVAAGKTTKVELGAPFGFVFDFTQSDETVEVKGKSIFVSGRGEETYQRLWNCVVHPEVLLRKAGGKRGSSEGKLMPATSQEEIVDNGDQTTAWFPIGAPVEKKKKGEAVEVQLYEKKNKLFGKIESAWKGE